MKRFVIVLAAAILVATVGAEAPLAGEPARPADAALVRVGTFDSRAIALT